jgi:uncharacterized protein
MADDLLETGGEALVLEHNGDLYSCDVFIEPGYLLGNIQQELLKEINRVNPTR